MKKSNCLFMFLGIGIGIILTSTIYILNPFIKYKPYSNEQVIEKAEELGMVFVKENINIEEDKKSQEDITINLNISDGDTLETVTKKLYNNGVIDDKEEFIQFVIDKDMDKKLLPGIYELKKNLSYSTIVKIFSHSDSE